MKDNELKAAAERLVSSRDPACTHLYNAHQQCQWCHRMRSDIDTDTLARYVLADLADRERLEAERALPVTEEWLRSIGGLPEDSNFGDICFRIFYLEPADLGTFVKGEFTHVVFCRDGSACIECYDENGHSLEVVGIGYYNTRGQVRRLLEALGVVK